MYKTGKCLCGNVHYQLNDAPLFVQACHCTLCQRTSGSAFNLISVIENKNFELLQGEVSTFEFVGGSGGVYDLFACNSCGTSMWGQPRERIKDMIYVRSGTLDNTADIKPMAHIFVGSKQNWVILDEETPQFDAMYDLQDIWPEESMRRLSKI